MAPLKRALPALVLLVVLTVLAAGCGGGDSDESGATTATTTTGGGTTTVDEEIAAQVPEKYKSAGKLVVAVDPTYPPNEFIDEQTKEIVGMTIDLGAALGGLMGVDFDFVQASFDAIIPGLESGKYDLGFSSFTDTKEREEVVDFVTYFEAGTSFYVLADGGPTINSLADLCGHSMAAQRGTIQVDDATEQNKKCKQQGKPGVKVNAYPDQNAVNLAVSSGRAEVGMADSPVAAYIVQQSNGQFELTGKPYDTAPYGIAIPKDSGLAEPLLSAVEEIMSNGTYMQILEKWGLEDGEISDPQINGAIS